MKYFYSITLPIMSMCFLVVPKATSETYYVTKHGSDTNNGLSWETAKSNLQAFVQSLDSNVANTVHIGAGEWVGGMIVPTNQALIGTNRDETILVGNEFGRVLTVAGRGSTFSNLTVQGGWARDSNGGGASGGTFYNCTIKNNTADYYGGGLYGSDAYNCLVVSNSVVVIYGTSGHAGGGAGSCNLVNCEVAYNISAGQRGGSGAWGSSLYSCNVHHNQSTLSGTGGGIKDSSAWGCTINSNTAYSGGGASGSQLRNCVLIGNTASAYGGALGWNDTGGASTAYNSIIIGNSSPFSDSINYAPYGGAENSLRNSIVYGNGATLNTYNGIWTAAVAFTNGWRLPSGHPCIDGGNNAYVDTTNDFYGRSRLYGANVDYGVAEWQPQDQAITFPTMGDKLTTDTVGLAATASSGLPVSFTVASGPATISGGTNLTFSAAGTVSVVASQGGDVNWNAAPDVTNTITVSKAEAQVFLLDLAQTYDGSVRTVTPTTMPAGLTVAITYDGSSTAPSNAGSYAITGTVNNVLYQGSATGMLAVSKADQTITFPPIDDQLTTNRVCLAATASSGLSVSFTVGGGPATVAGGTNLTFLGTGSVYIVASQGGSLNWNPAPTVTNIFNVSAAYSVTISNLVVAQRPGTKQVDISYDLSSMGVATATVSLAISDAGIPVISSSLSGDIGPVAEGLGKSIVWDMGADWDGNISLLSFSIMADIDVPLAPQNMVFVEGGSLSGLTVSSFYIGKYEVTWGEWQAVRSWSVTNGYGLPSTAAGCANNHPVQTLSWDAAVVWCNARSQKEGLEPVYYRTNGNLAVTLGSVIVVNSNANGYRLPEEDEWEFAARGGNESWHYLWSGSSSIDLVGWWWGTSSGAPCGYSAGHGTWPVGQKLPNELGIRDMTGNVWEWCYDYDPDLAGRRVVRGGSWSTAVADYCQVGYRSSQYPTDANYSTGFRVAASSLPWVTSYTDRENVWLDSRDYSFIVTSAHGAPSPAKGTNLYAWRATVTGTVASAITEGGISWRNSGWTGTGSIPGLGTTNATAAIILTNVTSSITWRWEQQSTFAITNLVATQRAGTKLVDITYDVLSDLPDSAPVTLLVEQDGVPISVSSLSGDVGAGVMPGLGKAIVWDAGADWGRNAAELTFFVMHSVQTQFVSSGNAFVDTRDYYTLTVASAHGTPVPSTGTHSYVDGAAFTNSLSGSPIVTGDMTQRVCTGWTLYGNEPTGGQGTNFVATITNDATLTWLWQTNVLLTATARKHGTVDGSGWQALGGSVTITAVPFAGHQFTGWLGDVPAGQSSSNPLTLTMDRPRTVGATFYTTFYVAATGGNDINSGLNWPAAKQTIQAALDEAADGDAVLVSNGLYGAISVSNVVRVESVNGATNTTIGGMAAGTRGVYLASNAVFVGFTVEGAQTDSNGAGIYAEFGVQIRRCIVRNNTTSQDGGGVYGGSLVNCLLVGNAAANGGAAANASLNHCTVAGNLGTVSGGGTKDCALLNSIVQRNVPSDWGGGSATYSCALPLPAGAGNLDGDPGFVDMPNGDFRLAFESPCLGVATSSGVSTDLTGTPRPQPTVYGGELAYDMGCYEYVPQARFVWTNGNAVAPYETWQNAANDIQTALDISFGGDRIVVEAGTYAPFAVSNAVVMLGYRGASNTVVDGGGILRPITITAPATLEGFTVQNGAAEDCGGILADNGAVLRDIRIANSQATAPDGYGGGLCLYNGSIAEDVTVVSNRAQYGAGIYATATSEVHSSTVAWNVSGSGWGGGVYLEDAGTLSDSLVEGNSSARGGGVYADESEVATTTIRSNLASEYGGGVALFGGTLRNSWIEDNDSWNGAGIYASDALGHSCIVAGNIASSRGGGVYMNGTSTFYNMTVVTNQAAVGGGGVWINGSGLLWNSIAMFNSPSNLAPGSGDIQFSCIAPPPAGIGNFEAEPLFVATNDFHLRAGSPCVDTGTNEAWMAENQDIDGQRRVMPMPPDDHPNPVRDVWIDVGADEAAVDAFSGPAYGNPFWGWNVVVDARLHMQATTNLVIPVLWTNIGTVVTANQATLLIPYTNTDRMRHFRLIWEKP